MRVAAHFPTSLCKAEVNQKDCGRTNDADSPLEAKGSHARTDGHCMGGEAEGKEVIESRGRGKRAHFCTLYVPPNTGMSMAIRPAALSMTAPCWRLSRVGRVVSVGSSGWMELCGLESKDQAGKGKAPVPVSKCDMHVYQ